MRTLRRTAGAAAALGSLFATGCYTLQPVAGSTLTEGTPIGLDITDAGRVALGGSMGPSILRAEGRLLRREGDAYVVAVSGVDYLTGGSQRWSGEPVVFRPEHIGAVYARRLSKGRTLAASAVGLGAVAFIVTRSIVGGGTADNPTNPRDSVGTTHRGPRP